MVAQHYRWDFIGLSTDDKPTPQTSEKVADGSTFYCSDNSKLYVWYNDQWYEKEATGGGGGEGDVKTLTSADYNYPAINPNSIALWLLESGIYQIVPGDGETLTLYRTTQDSQEISGPIYVIINKRPDGYRNIFVPNFGVTSSQFGSSSLVSQTGLDYSFGTSTQTGDYAIVVGKMIVNSLTSTSERRCLSAKQGKVLNDKIDGRIIQNTGAPTTATVGTVGQLLEDTTNGKLYQCTAVSGDTYTWTEVGGGGGGGFVELTTADYNYHEGSGGVDDSVALWLLPIGTYKISAGVKFYPVKATTFTRTYPIYVTVNHEPTGTYAVTNIYENNGVLINYCADLTTGTYHANDRYDAKQLGFLTGGMVTDNLTSSSTVSPLSAKQGKALKDLIDALDVRITALGG